MTHEIRLRNVIEEDLPIFFEHQIDPDFVAMAAQLPQDQDAFQAHWTELLARESVIKKTIFFDDRL